MDISSPGLKEFQTDYRSARGRNMYWHATDGKFYDYDPRLWVLTELQRSNQSGLSFDFHLRENVPSDKELKSAFALLREGIDEIRKANPKANLIWSPKTFKYFNATKKVLPAGKGQDEPLQEFDRARRRCAEEFKAGVLADSDAYYECVERARIIYDDKKRTSKPST